VRFPAPLHSREIKHLIAFENRINNLAWMSPETKVSAVEKLHMSKLKLDILTNGKIIQP
jgi:endothelin-converting enzyme/putative endopeptidase